MQPSGAADEEIAAAYRDPASEVGVVAAGVGDRPERRPAREVVGVDHAVAEVHDPQHAAVSDHVAPEVAARGRRIVDRVGEGAPLEVEDVEPAGRARDQPAVVDDERVDPDEPGQHAQGASRIRERTREHAGREIEDVDQAVRGVEDRHVARVRRRPPPPCLRRRIDKRGSESERRGAVEIGTRRDGEPVVHEHGVADGDREARAVRAVVSIGKDQHGRGRHRVDQQRAPHVLAIEDQQQVAGGADEDTALGADRPERLRAHGRAGAGAVAPSPQPGSVAIASPTAPSASATSLPDGPGRRVCGRGGSQACGAIPAPHARLIMGP